MLTEPLPLAPSGGILGTLHGYAPWRRTPLTWAHVDIGFEPKVTVGKVRPNTAQAASFRSVTAPLRCFGPGRKVFRIASRSITCFQRRGMALRAMYLRRAPIRLIRRSRLVVSKLHVNRRRSGRTSNAVFTTFGIPLALGCWRAEWHSLS